VLRFAKVLRGMLAGRVVAAADVSARGAEAEMHPAAAHPETLFAAARRAGLNAMNLVEMSALCGHWLILLERARCIAPSKFYNGREMQTSSAPWRRASERYFIA
jgi:hypothetical protein